MSPDNFKNHQVFEKIEQLAVRIFDEEARQKIDIDSLHFFQTAQKYISDRLRITIPILLNDSELSALRSEIDAGLQQINNFLGSGNIGHITNANNNFHSAINRVRVFPLLFAKGDFDFSKAAANYEEILKGKYQDLEVRKNELAAELQEHEASLLQEKDELKRLYQLFAEKELEIKNLSSQFHTDFNSIKATATQDFEADRKSFKSEISSDRAAFRVEIESYIASLDSDTTAIVSQLDAKLDEAKKIVNVIGNVGVTGNYQLIANEHRRTADMWRWITVIFMTIFSGLLIWTIIDLSSTGFDWVKSLIRIVAAAALSYPATYAARESSRHRKLETVNRTAELELASLSPFIELLPKDKQETIKEKLVEKYFGNNNNDIMKSSHEEELSISGFEKILKAVTPLFKK